MRAVLEYIGQISIAFGTILALLFLVTEALPEQAPIVSASHCSCDNRPGGCRTATFVIDGRRRAYCALFDDGVACCEIGRPE